MLLISVCQNCTREMEKESERGQEGMKKNLSWVESLHSEHVDSAAGRVCFSQISAAARLFDLRLHMWKL